MLQGDALRPQGLGWRNACHDVAIDKSIMSILEGYIYIYLLFVYDIQSTHVVCVHLQVANADIYKLQTKGYET